METKKEGEQLLKVVEKNGKIRNFKNGIEKAKFQPVIEKRDLKLYKRRWLILFLYVAYMLCNSSQWLQYSIISNIVEKYYGVSEWHVNLTSLVMMMCYIPLGLPAAYLMDRVGLRWTALLGVAGTSLGSWVKLLSASRDRFPLGLAGQVVVAAAQVLMLSVPQKLSSTWFGEREVSTACSIGVFGFQLGIVVGFYLPPTLVRNHDSLEAIGDDLYRMFLYFAIASSLVAVLVYLFFEAAPRNPPTVSQARALRSPTSTSYLPTLKRLFTKKDITAMFVLTGVNNGCFNGLSTLLNQIFLEYFPGMQEEAGRVGVTMVIFGMTASVTFGLILDRSKRFKLVLLAVYYMSGVAMLAFAFLLKCQSLPAAYAGAAFVGTFLCGFTAVSFDVATELTYPESELIVGTIMNIMSLFFTILATLLFGWINKNFGSFYGNLGFVITLILGASGMLPIQFRLKRSLQNERVMG